jgi:threonylcarbamoyladenosine tRNA methylthiotransferase MtaB
MPQVPPQIVKERARRLREAAARRKALWLHSQIGGRQKVLVERGGDFGHAENFAPVRVAGGEVGRVKEVMIGGIRNGVLLGEAL